MDAIDRMSLYYSHADTHRRPTGGFCRSKKINPFELAQ
jgi:hypothetical protein